MIISADIDQLIGLSTFAAGYRGEYGYMINILKLGRSEYVPREMFNLLELEILNLNIFRDIKNNITPFNKIFPHIKNCKKLRVIYYGGLGSAEIGILSSQCPFLTVR